MKINKNIPNEVQPNFVMSNITKRANWNNKRRYSF